MNPLLKLFVLGTVLLLAACSQAPLSVPSSTPSGSANHPRFAPPPGAQSRWDGQLGVYVLGSTRDLYYRERTYYRWSSGWSWASNPNGPWLPTDSSGVPPGLNSRYAQ